MSEHEPPRGRAAAARTGTVLVSRARLHTERLGQGPALVLISGGGGDAGMYEDVVPLLAERFTVITFDRRGNSRSPLADPAAPVAVARQADDVIAILDHYGIERAYVFGNSGGAIITLELLAHHAGRLLGAVVHEPPLIQVLPCDSPERKALEDIERLGREKGPLRASAAFGAMTLSRPPRMFVSPRGQAVIAAASRVLLAAGGPVRRATGREPDTMTRMLGNSALLIERELPDFCFAYQPDLEALRHVDVPWCLATGRDSQGRPYHRPAHVLSGLLGVACEEFPGGHTVYQRLPAEFTQRLTTILDALPS
ncbi:alpha/beta fold hydrolase [Streptomyces aurantiacus]|uniref:alpha/beta fold hydrolase n=1 Tax=Streptomyces aurantiacus TaxID=47760 RepID=UPI001681D540|nr:alpha/beta hydrolase [Streptomyces aurantiacus]